MEVGSEFNISLSDLNVKEDNFISYISNYGEAIHFDSGRSAIRAIAAFISYDYQVLLPDYICESVIKCFNFENVVFYKTNNNFTIDMDDFRKKALGDPKVFFLMHYYGKLQSRETLDEIAKLASSSGSIIIEDATHSLFTEVHTIGDYVVASERKWLPVPKAGLLITVNDKLGIGEPVYERTCDNSKAFGMILKTMFLQGEMDCNAVYRKIFASSEEALDRQDKILGISDFSEFVLKSTDVKNIKTKRLENYKSLRLKLEAIGVSLPIDFNDEECPFALPIRVPDRDLLRAYLIDNKVFCAVHWPSDGIRENERVQAVKNSRELISLPIDQRYGEEHMDYIAKAIEGYRGRLQF